MQRVKCISSRPGFNQPQVGNYYLIDTATIAGDSDGDWYVNVYNTDGKSIGRFKLSHFKSVSSTRVRYIHENTENEKASGCYPPIGTLGTIINQHNDFILVRWDSGTKNGTDWWCFGTDVEILDADK